MSALSASTGHFAKPSVLIYSNASIAEDPSSLEANQFLAYYLYLWKKLTGHSSQHLATHFSGINFYYEDYAFDQDTDYNTIEPYLFLYLTTIIPRTPSDSFAKYQGNKVKGLVRQCAELGVDITERNYIIGADVVREVKEFMDSHHHLFAECFASFLSVAEEANKMKAGYAYATELKPSVRYVNMVGIMMIEDVLISPTHLILTHYSLAQAVKSYDKFKTQLVDMYGSNWVYGAVLARNAWNQFKSEHHFKLLWITAGLLCDGTDHRNYRNVTIGGSNVLQYANTNPYKEILRFNRTLEQSETFVATSSIHNDAILNQIKSQFNSWTGDDNSLAQSKDTRYSS